MDRNAWQFCCAFRKAVYECDVFFVIGDLGDDKSVFHKKGRNQDVLFKLINSAKPP
ncbi:hypothetical protein PTUN_b0908 [Pseudoalteromonas tunicata]|nr:hypothetical protein PTUN_b0908 [Pseudoalteromonas tunicata]